ncbi:glycosyltransferase family 4 protein [Enemella evansiae]|uniref:glycosyltransferase family 4 protein n=1 Tax=Enemella evansiae TaxID=2016499 RepID=UPI000C00669A|nr:glycosyltransferase family 4 protein [Enemella evansiae]PFG66386.1 glycosyltransferase involved in cell wall biosynthesis [Propionibacteriaceae bacterium ES.041]TDO88020.1 glycosyltransferase involved in cell wall biosynthesis [Enemella evansiae]
MLRVQMSGADWFDTRAGGLNRYFTDLWLALRARPRVSVKAVAFGAPDAAGGHSWPGQDAPFPARVLSSALTHRVPRGTVLDRHFAPYGPLPAPAVRRPRGPVVTHFHGPWAGESAAAGERAAAVALKRRIELVRYRGSDAYVVLSRYFARLLATDYRIPADRIRVIPPGVDLDRFAVPQEPAGPPTVLCVRRLERRMGIDTLLTAWPAVAAALPEARLIVVGTGTEEAALRAQATGLSGVTFTGRVTDDEIAELYRRATVSVVPTRSLEGFGLVCLESLASGRAPVVTDAGGLADSVIGLDPSLVVPREHPEALAERLVAALRGRRPDARACRAHAETFTWAASAAAHEALYRELIG